MSLNAQDNLVRIGQLKTRHIPRSAIVRVAISLANFSRQHYAKSTAVLFDQNWKQPLGKQIAVMIERSLSAI